MECPRRRRGVAATRLLWNIHVVAAASPRPVSSGYPLHPTTLHGISTSWPWRRRDQSPRNIHAAAAASLRLVFSGLHLACAPRYKGAFSLIELAASSFEAAGGAGELSRADFVEALQARRAALERELNPSESVADRARANDPHNDKLVKDLVYATSLIAFVDLAFAKDATFSTLPARAVGSAPATNWALGLYLEQRGMLP